MHVYTRVQTPVEIRVRDRVELRIGNAIYQQQTVGISPAVRLYDLSYHLKSIVQNPDFWEKDSE
jgi:hypothetical protein